MINENKFKRFTSYKKNKKIHGDGDLLDFHLKIHQNRKIQLLI